MLKDCQSTRVSAGRKILINLTAIILIILGVAFCQTLSSEDVYAAEIVGYLNDQAYGDFEALYDDLENNYAGKTVTITMAEDWDAGENSDFNHRLIIPKNCKATLDMRGRIFDRRLSRTNDWAANGELICIRTGATLTINGHIGDHDAGSTHTTTVYTSNDSGNKATHEEVFHGGVLAGGCSYGGAGCIHVESNTTLTLNDVTIAGCRTEAVWYTAWCNGLGGAIYLTNENTTLKLKNSTITGNYSSSGGGGICTGVGSNVKIELDNSHVDKNYSGSGGGGIDMNGKDVSVCGKNGSTVSNNVAAKQGGGINLCGEKEKVDELTIEGNRAKQGGGIYTAKEKVTLSDLKVSKNTATDKGGGIYIYNDETSIVSCDIQDNDKEGVYVDKDVDVGFTIGGLTTIKYNSEGNLTLKDGSCKVSIAPKKGSEIHLGYAEYKQEIYAISPPIGNDQYNAVDARKFLVPDNKDYVVAYIYDSQPSSTLSVKSIRGNFLIRKSAYSKYEEKGYEILNNDLVKVRKKIRDAGPEVIGSVYAGGSDYTAGSGSNVSGRYPLIRGLLHREMTESGSVDKENLFYYSDGLFYSDPYEYNDHLATLSWSLAFGGTYLRLGGKDSEAYKYKHTGARQFLADLGCTDQSIYVNDSNKSKPGTDTIGVTIGSKNLKEYDRYGNLVDTGDILIPVTVRGGGYENEWASNVTLGSGSGRNGEAKGFSEAADQVMSAIEYYITKYSLEDEIKAGKVKFWVSGFSRAGATANITSKRLIEKYADGTDGKKNQVFSYPCEAAKGGTNLAEKLRDKTKYYCIHNLVNTCDVVPYVGPAEMGFKRYGVDHYIPGTQTKPEVSETTETVTGGGSSGITEVTTYCDNEPLRTKIALVSGDDPNNTYYEYKSRRGSMINYLESIDSELNFNDFFTPRGLSFIPPQYGYAGYYEGAYLDDYLGDFLAFLQKNGLQGRGRKGYSELVTTINGSSFTTLEKAVRDVMTSDSLSALTNNTSAITGNLTYFAPFSSDISALEVYREVVGNWGRLNDGTRLHYMHYFWSLIKDSGALDSLSDDELAKIEKNLPTLLNVLLYYLDGDWNSYPDKDGFAYPRKQWVHYRNTTHFLMYSLTLYNHMNMILTNHFPEVNMAWCRTYDSWFNEIDDRSTSYNDALAEYQVIWGGLDGKPVSDDRYRVAAPSAAIENGSSDYQLLKPSDKDANNLRGMQKILLEVGKFNDAEPGDDNVIGEAIYYDLYDVTGGEDDGQAKLIEKTQLYRGGITLQNDDSSRPVSKYKVTAYARSYGIHSDPVTYYINVWGSKHAVNIFNLSTETADSQRYYSEGEKVTISAVDGSGDNKFNGWTITADMNGASGIDVTEILLGSGEDSIAEHNTITFTMPKAGDTVGRLTWAEDYTLTVKQNNFRRIRKITVKDLTAPATFEELDNKAKLSFDSDSAEDLDVGVKWTYTCEEGTAAQPSETEAYKDTAYTAIIKIQQDLPNRLAFATVTDGLEAEIDPAVAKSIKAERSDVDGSVTITITFNETENTEGGKIRPLDYLGLTVRPFDLNKETAIHDYDDTVENAEYLVQQGDIIWLTAPDIKDMQFVRWNLGDSGVTLVYGYDPTEKTIEVVIPRDLTVDELSIDADYVAVVNEVHATIDAPVFGKPLPGADRASLKVRISEMYEVDPENIEVTWTPEDSKAKKRTSYTAILSLRPDQSGKIGVRKAGSDGSYSPYNLNDISFAETVTATCNGEAVSFDPQALSVCTTFEPVRSKAVQYIWPDDIGPLEFGSGKSDVAAALPKNTKVLLDDGSEITADIQWEDPVKTSESDDPLEESVWSTPGKIILPEDVEAADFENDITVTVQAAKTARMPEAFVPSGTYMADQVVTLSTETEGADIWYTVDGSDPFDTANAERKKYAGEDIHIIRDDDSTSVTIRAYAEKEGMLKSAEALFQYDFCKEITLPADLELTYDGTAKTGVYGTNFFTLEAVDDTVTIDGNGNATAVNAGTYKVIARIKDGLAWLVDENGENKVTTDDQELTFTIDKADLSKIASIQAAASYKTLDALKQGIKVVSVDGTELDPSIYEISYAQKSNGTVTVTVSGTGNYTGSIVKNIPVTKKVNRKKQMGFDNTPFGKGAAMEAADAAIAKLKSEKDPKGTKFAALRLKSTRQTKKSIKLTWTKVRGAKKYVLYGAKCGKTSKYKKLATLGASKKSYTVKKIRNALGLKTAVKKGQYYRFLIIALDSNNDVLSTSKVIHVATKGKPKKAGNAKKVIVKAKIDKKGKKLKKYKSTSAITLRAGQTPKNLVHSTKIKASFTKSGTVKKHVGIRFESSNTKIATVSSKGKITAKKKGKCKIYVFTQNGLCKIIKVTVK